MYIQIDEYDTEPQVVRVGGDSQLLPYPINISSCLALSDGILDDTEVLCRENPPQSHPTAIAYYALAHWNQYLTSNEKYHLKIFLSQAQWFIEHEKHICDYASGWPISRPCPKARSGSSCLSASAQSGALSVLVRAYQLTGEDRFLVVAQRAVRVFERDILDGGVSSPIGEEGIFFEGIAIYPAIHIFSSFALALLGLYDYVAITGDVQIKHLIQRGLATMHNLLDEFDIGYWIRVDLHHQELATPTQLAFHAELLGALALNSGCEYCDSIASRWKDYQRQPISRLRYMISSRFNLLNRALLNRVRKALFPLPPASQRLHVCIPITGFPISGGTRAVLLNVSQVTADIWDIEYLTRRVGPEAKGLIIHTFGSGKMTPRHFPTVWLYFFAGLRKLLSLMRNGTDYHLIMPQDGVFTSAFAALAAKFAGRRVVCIDHGNLTLLENRSYRIERIQALEKRAWTFRLVARFLFLWYWSSLHLLAWFAAHLIDHYLVPGVAGDGIEEICKRLGIPPSRLTRFASMIDVARYPILEIAERTSLREKKGIPADAIVIAMVCRLAPEKGIGIALQSIGQAFSILPPELRRRIRVIIAGDGPERKQLEHDIQARGLSETCVLWGETSPSDVTALLSMSDIFLYTSIRGACLSMAVLEAMASGCAVIASTRPLSNASMLAEGRGIAVLAEDVEHTTKSLVQLLTDVRLCHQMGRNAREYVAIQHNAAIFKRVLMRVTFWPVSNEML